MHYSDLIPRLRCQVLQMLDGFLETYDRETPDEVTLFPYLENVICAIHNEMLNGPHTIFTKKQL